MIQQCMSTQANKKIVLVLDGGGVRGVAGLELCCKLAQSQDIPLSKLFGMVVGGSAGAILACVISVGFLDDAKTAPEMCKRFHSILPLFFSEPNGGGGWLAPRYKDNKKRAVLEELLEGRKLGDAKVPLVILCSSTEGDLVEYSSLNPHQRELPLSTLLLASSAAHTFWSPVEIEPGVWRADGAVRSAKCLLPALLSALAAFRDQPCSLYMLSLGTYVGGSGHVFHAGMARVMGIIAWASHGLLEILLGARDRTDERVLEQLFGDRFLRLEANCDQVKLDDISPRTKQRLINAANLVWEQSHERLLAFVKPFPT